MERIFIIVLLSTLAWGCRQAEPSSPASEPSPAQPSERYMVGAHYYSWYPENFNNGVLRRQLHPPQEPRLGLYSSSDVEVAQRQIALASQFGIDFFALDFWPHQVENQDYRIDSLLRAENIDDIKFCLFIEIQQQGYDAELGSTQLSPSARDRLYSSLETVAERYFDHPSYLRVGQRPVLILYLTRTLLDSRQIIPEIRRRLTEHNVYLIGDEVFWDVTPVDADGTTAQLSVQQPQSERIQLFDAITSYNYYYSAEASHSGYGSSTSFVEDVRELHRRYATACQGEIPVIPSVIPGYNDRGRRLEEDHFAIPRQWSPEAKEGSFFGEFLDRYAMKSLDWRLPMLLVTSWNEWSEDTGIEPLQGSRPSRVPSEVTQGYLYAPTETVYLEVLRDRTIAVAGRLRTREGKALANRAVSAWNDERRIATDFTDQSGYYTLSRRTVPPGTYFVGVSKRTARQVEVKTGSTAVLNLEQR